MDNGEILCNKSKIVQGPQKVCRQAAFGPRAAVCRPLVYMFTIREVGLRILPERYGGAILENAELSRRLIVFVDALGR